MRYSDFTKPQNKKILSLMERADKQAGLSGLHGNAHAQTGASAEDAFVGAKVSGGIGAEIDLTQKQKKEAELVGKLHSSFPIDGWEKLSTKEQLQAMKSSGLSDQEQWTLLNSSTDLSALADYNAQKANAIMNAVNSSDIHNSGAFGINFEMDQNKRNPGYPSKLPSLQSEGPSRELKRGNETSLFTEDNAADHASREFNNEKINKKIKNAFKETPNGKHIQMFNLNNPDPYKLSDGEYYYVDESTVIGGFVFGHTVVFDAEKYAEYKYVGYSLGKSLVPADHLWVKGYVNNIYEVDDFEGAFVNFAGGIGAFGSSASLGYNNDKQVYIVSASDVAQQLYAGAGLSVQYFTSLTPEWISGEAPIRWGATTYDWIFNNYCPEEI